MQISKNYDRNNTKQSKALTPFKNPCIDTSWKKKNEAEKERVKNYFRFILGSRMPCVPRDKSFDGSSIFNNYYSKIKAQFGRTKHFDVANFLRGPKATSPEIERSNNLYLKDSINFVEKIALEISQTKSINLIEAYKQIIGCLDIYDDIFKVENIWNAKKSNRSHDTVKASPQESTFLLRSAVLLASQANGCEMPSWMVYTKIGKPLLTPENQDNLWPFLDNWNNWVPEAKGAIAKFSEITIIKANRLAKKSPQNQIILLKGGYGAGKSYLAKELFQESVGGVFAPDLGKQTVRRSMESITHNSAHIAGSQVSYQLFHGMIKSMAGTVVYDSSMRYSKDIEHYLKEGYANGKKVVIYEVARCDEARALSVLKRPIKGDDPVIPPEIVINSAVGDKMHRKSCIDAIYRHEVPAGKEALAPEYHFLSFNEKGVDRKEVMTIKPQSILVNESCPERLKLVELSFNILTQSLDSLALSQDLRNAYNATFQRSVKEIMETISPEEKSSLEAVFSNRVLNFDGAVVVCNEKTLYNALPLNFKEAIHETAFCDAFASIPVECKDNFFNTLAGLKEISYLDLPFKVALIIHQNLKFNPWEMS